jgi:hypothetical protein
LEETFTVTRLDLSGPDECARSVAPREALGKGGTVFLRWTVAGVLDARRNFRKVAGYRSLTKQVAALRAHDAVIDRERRVDNRRRTT